jgi:hypothetical protein
MCLISQMSAHIFITRTWKYSVYILSFIQLEYFFPRRSASALRIQMHLLLGNISYCPMRLALIPTIDSHVPWLHSWCRWKSQDADLHDSSLKTTLHVLWLLYFNASVFLLVHNWMFIRKNDLEVKPEDFLISTENIEWIYFFVVSLTLHLEVHSFSFPNTLHRNNP